MQNEKKLYILDGSSFLYRSYYALKPLHAPDGSQVQAVYGFARMIKKLIKDFKPDYFVLVWDSKGKTTRHELYPDYKVQRQAPPSDLFEQKVWIQEFAELIGLRQLTITGIEADDLMGSLAQDAVKEGCQAVLVTSDKDMRQIVTDDIVVFDPFKDSMLDVPTLEQKYGFPLSKLPFYFAIIGDASDNIPGVKGIGPKGAEKLVKQFDSLEDLYQNLDQAGSERTQKLLSEGKENAFLSEKLFTLRHYTTGITVHDCTYDNANFSKAAPLFERFNFKSLLKEIGHAPVVATQSFSQRYGYEFECVTTQEQLEALGIELRNSTAFAFDTETDTVEALQSTLVGMSFCCKKGKAYYVPVAHSTSETQLPKDIIFNVLKPILEDPKIKKYLHHAKFDMLVLSAAGIELQGLEFDTLVAAGLVKQGSDRLSLKIISEKYLDEVMTTYQQVVTDQKLENFSQVSLLSATDYAAADAHQTWQLVPLLKKELQEQSQENLYEKLELPLVTVLYEMEREGILLDPSVLYEIDKQVTHKLTFISKEISLLSGIDEKSLNLNSSRQVGELLFEKLGLEPAKKTAKKTGHSTDQEVLSLLAKEHPVPGLILEYRELYKLKSTYIDALPEYINPRTGRIHTTFKQTSVATGRLASSDPNLQNIPDNESAYPIRAAFKAEPGNHFISADYSQMELRVLAHFSGDKNLVNAFLAGEDVHAHTAAGLFKIALNEVTHEQRQLAKRINFSILYGLTPYGLARDLDISHSQAKEFIDRYMAHYPQVQEWMESVVADTIRDGYVTTWFGRRRYIPEIYEKNHALQQLGRRLAINTKAQGTAAEIVKLGMLHVHDVCSKTMPNVKMLLQIHDELLLTVPTHQIDEASTMIKTVLENVVTWNVPFVVTVRHGLTWQDVSK